MGITRIRLDADGRTLVECAEALDRATEFCLGRRWYTEAPVVDAPVSHVGSVVATFASSSASFERLFEGDHSFVEEVFESKIRPSGAIYYVGRRVVALDDTPKGNPESVDEIRGTMDGIPQVASVPLAVDVCGVTTAVTIPTTGSTLDVIEAIAASDVWLSRPRSAGQFRLAAFDKGEMVPLYSGSVPDGDRSIALTTIYDPVLVGGTSLWLSRHQPLYLSSVDEESERTSDGCLFVPARAHRDGEGLAVDVIVRGRRTNVWVAPDVTGIQAALIAREAIGDRADGAWELRDHAGALVDLGVLAAALIGGARTPLHFDLRPGVGG